MIKNSKYKLFVSLYLLLFFAVSGLEALEFYWEEPQLFSPGTGTFPVSAFSGNLSALAWQEAAPNRTGGSIYINLAVKIPGGDWQV